MACRFQPHFLESSVRVRPIRASSWGRFAADHLCARLGEADMACSAWRGQPENQDTLKHNGVSRLSAQQILDASMPLDIKAGDFGGSRMTL
jgi:hypothetical protein